MKRSKWAMGAMLCAASTMMLGMPVFAATAEDAGEKVSVSIGSYELQEGDTEVTIPVELKENPGLVSLTIEVSYDTDVLERVSITEGDVFTKGSLTQPPATTKSPFKLAFDDSVRPDADPNCYEVGTLATLTFNVVGDVQVGDKIDISAVVTSAFDTNFEDEQIADVVTGVVEVVEKEEPSSEEASSEEASSEEASSEEASSEEASSEEASSEEASSEEASSEEAPSQSGSTEGEEPSDGGDTSPVAMLLFVSVIALMAGGVTVVASKKYEK